MEKYKTIKILDERDEEEIKEKDKEDKAIKFYKNFIEAQEKELDWLEKEDEEYYKDEIEEKQLLIKGFKTIQKLIENQKAEIEEKDKSLKLHTKLEYQYKNDYLNVIEDLKKKDKEIKCLKCLQNTQVEIIDLMAEKLKQLREASLEDCFIPKSYRNIDDCLRTTCEECIKQYFEKKAEEE